MNGVLCAQGLGTKGIVLRFLDVPHLRSDGKFAPYELLSLTFPEACKNPGVDEIKTAKWRAKTHFLLSEINGTVKAIEGGRKVNLFNRFGYLLRPEEKVA